MSQGQAIEQAADLLGIDAAEAGRRARLILRAAPGDPRAALILASAHRRLGEIHAAHALLEPLARAWPNAAQTQYELGLVLAAMGQTDAAIAALRRAVAAKRDLAEAWRALGDQLFVVGDVAGADLAFAEHARAAVRDSVLRPAADALLAGRPAEAEQRLLAALATSPDHAEALHLLGDALIRQGRDAEAEPLIARCLALDPAFDGARFTYANLLFRRQRGRQALAEIETLWVRDPQTPAYRNLLAACLALVGEHARAIDLYDGLLRQFAKQPKIWLNLGHALRTVGRRPEAVTAYRTCLAIAPGLGEAYWSLANLKAAELTAADEAAMIRLLSSGGLADDDRLHLHFALGKTLEDRGAFAASFEHYAKGAGLRRAALAYDADAATAMMQRNRAVFTPPIRTRF